MTDVRWQDAVRRLYDWYRNASDDAVYTGWNKPGWIDAAEGTDARRRLADVVNLDDRENLDALLEALAARNLGPALGFTRPEIRLTVARRRPRSKQLLFKFLCDPPLKKGAGRDRLPPSIVQASLFETNATAVGPSLSSASEAATEAFQSAHERPQQRTDGPTPSSDGPTNTRSVDDGPWHNDPATEWHNSPSSEWHSSDSVPSTESHVSDVVPNDRIVYSDAAIDDDPIDLDNLPDGWNDDEKDWTNADDPVASTGSDDDHDLAENELAVDEILRRFAESQNAKTGPVEVVTAPWGEASMTVSFVMRDRGLQMMNEKGRLVVCKPSPGVGKTFAMIELATTYHRARKRVIFGVFAKEQTEEVRERFKRADGTVVLRVITGRDETNCNSFDQVEAASQQGYAPGGTVCLGCAYYPENARRLGSNSVCLYYQERIRACQDFNMARRGVRRYPIILTTHTSAVLGQRVARSKHGTFWHTDFVFFDEDCSSAFASDHILRQDNLGFQKPDHPYAGFNAAIREAMRIAGHERTAAMRRNWKSYDDPSEPDPIHSRHGSAYVGEALWELLERVIQLPTVQRFYRDPLTKAHGLATRILSHDDSDQPDVGEFATLPPNRIASDYPHRDLNVFADLLDKEHWALEAERQSGNNHALSYQVRLEFTTIPDEEGNKHWLWQLAALTTRSYAVQDHNIVVGDAYADPEMYRRLFPLQRLETIDVRAHWPENTFCFTILAHASIGDVGNSRDQFLYYLNGHIAPIMEGQRGRRVLFYTHKSLAKWLNEWLHETSERWGVREWAVEHYGGGRGKDQYRDWDTVITATEYIPNMGGLVHIANAMNPGQLRVEHWSGDRPRKGRQTFGQSIDDMDPRLRGLFWRKCVDELAQAIHRIRPAIPRGADAPPKQIYIFRKHIPLADDLLSATSFFVASGDTDEGVQVDDTKGKRATARSLVAFVSPEEMARAIRGTRDRVGFWGHFAAHSLTALVWDHSSLSRTLTLGLPTAMAQDDTGEETNVPLSPKPSAGDSLRISPRELSPAESDSLVSALCDRVLFPTKDWEERAEIVRDSYAYRAAMRLLVDGDALGRRAEIRASWSSGPGSRFVCWGDGEAARNVLDGYDPKLLAALEAPF